MNTQTEKQIEGTVVHTSHLAHVTFYITEDNGTYRLYSESAKFGLQECRGELSRWRDYRSYEEVSDALAKEQEKLEQTLERKRKGIPTPKQLHFLFGEKIPIPLDLTWGQASDLIDERLAQIEYDKLERRAQRFKGFTEGMRVVQVFKLSDRRYTGTITKLTSNNRGDTYAYVKWDNKDVYGGESRTNIDTLHKIEEERQ